LELTPPVDELAADLYQPLLGLMALQMYSTKGPALLQNRSAAFPALVASEDAASRPKQSCPALWSESGQQEQ
jgi:hypothetical protein